jgi:hypothetical protein
MVLAFGVLFIGCNPGNGPGDNIYAVTIGTLTNANGSTITANPESGTEGTEITLTVTPGSGYQLKAGTLTYGTTAIDEVTKKFNLPASDVTVTAEFEPSGPIDNVIQKTVEQMYKLAADLDDISSRYGGTFENGWIQDASDIAGIYLDSAETQPLSKSTIITAGMSLYARQSVWDEFPYSSSGNNVVAEIYRGTYAVDPLSEENLYSLTIGEHTIVGTGPGGGGINGTGLLTKGGGNLVSGGANVGTWAYVYSIRTKQGFVYQLTGGSPTTKFYMGPNAASAASTVSSLYGIAIDLSDIASEPWGIYAVKNPFLGTWNGTNEGTDDLTGFSFVFSSDSKFIQKGVNGWIRGTYEYTTTQITITPNELSSDQGINWGSHVETPQVMSYEKQGTTKIIFDSGARVIVFFQE